MDTMSPLQLFLKDSCLGSVVLTGMNGRNGEGLLTPTPAYYPVRPSLQVLTSNMAQHAGADPLHIKSVLTAAEASLRDAGLHLRDRSGKPLRAEFIMVSDYYPLDCEPRLLGTALPLLVTFTVAP